MPTKRKRRPRKLATRYEAVIATEATGKVKGTARHFAGNRAQHGAMRQRTTGHHSTSEAKQLRTLFPKKEQTRLESALSKRERKNLRWALGGWLLVSDGVIQRWKSLLRSHSSSCKAATEYDRALKNKPPRSTVRSYA
jgi:hypothetical protein